MPDRTKQVNDLVKIPRQVAVWARMVADQKGYGHISAVLSEALAGAPVVEECRVYADDFAVRAYRGAKSIRVGINDGYVLAGLFAEERCDKRLTVGAADTLLAKSPGRTAFREFCGLPSVEGEKPDEGETMSDQDQQQHHQRSDSAKGEMPCPQPNP
jgi:hypothetical protein